MDIRTERLRRAFEKSKLTQSELCEKAGINKGAFSSYLSGRYFPKQKALEKLASVLDVSIKYLMGIDDLPAGEHSNPFIDTVMIPILGSVPAGTPTDAVTDILGEVDIPRSWTRGGEEHYALKVKGDSMSPQILDGDTVIFRVQSNCENGDTCVAQINGYDATVKKLVKNATSRILQPINPAYDPIVFTGDESEPTLDILGVVVELRRKI